MKRLPSQSSSSGFLSRNRVLSLSILAVIAILVGGRDGEPSIRSALQFPVGPLFSWSSFQPANPPEQTPDLLVLGKEVYRGYCAICHGENGQGNGWRAHMLYPKPRNFTRGIFRFKTTESGDLPTDRDLFRTVSVGLQSTAMPAWRFLLPEKERWAVVAYLKTFSSYFEEELPADPIPLGPEPAITPRAVELGRQLFQKAGCVDCHGSQGYGDGPSARGMEDSFGNVIAPRNLHVTPEFKRGRTLRDVAVTVSTGNDGTPMPSFKDALTQAQIWNLASFVMSLEEEPPVVRGPQCPMMAGIW